MSHPVWVGGTKLVPMKEQRAFWPTEPPPQPTKGNFRYAYPSCPLPAVTEEQKPTCLSS